MIEENGNGLSHLSAIPEPYRPAPPAPLPIWEPEPEEPAVSLSQYLWILKRHRWKILACIFVCMVATAIVSVRLTRIYESTATIDIDRRIPTGILGQEATEATTNDADQFMATQVKLIQSNAVLRPIALKYHLRERERGITELAGPDQEHAPVVLKKLEVTRPPNTYLLLIA